MAKIICKNCGQKNPSYAAVCSSCGNFLVDDTSGATAGPAQEVQLENSAQTTADMTSVQETTQKELQDTQDYQGRMETISVASNNSRQIISMVLTFGVLAVFIALEYLVKGLSNYLFLGFFVVIFAMSSLFRRGVSGVKFTQTGFTFPNANNNETFAYDSLDKLTIGTYDRYSQSLTMFFKENHPPVQVEFRSYSSFRGFVMMLGRRHVTIIPPNKQTSSGS